MSRDLRCCGSTHARAWTLYVIARVEPKRARYFKFCNWLSTQQDLRATSIRPPGTLTQTQASILLARRGGRAGTPHAGGHGTVLSQAAGCPAAMHVSYCDMWAILQQEKPTMRHLAPPPPLHSRRRRRRRQRGAGVPLSHPGRPSVGDTGRREEGVPQAGPPLAPRCQLCTLGHRAIQGALVVPSPVSCWCRRSLRQHSVADWPSTQPPPPVHPCRPSPAPSRFSLTTGSGGCTTTPAAPAARVIAAAAVVVPAAAGGRVAMRPCQMMCRRCCISTLGRRCWAPNAA